MSTNLYLPEKQVLRSLFSGENYIIIIHVDEDNKYDSSPINGLRFAFCRTKSAILT